MRSTETLIPHSLYAGKATCYPEPRLPNWYMNDKYVEPMKFWTLFVTTACYIFSILSNSGRKVVKVIWQLCDMVTGKQ